MHVVGDLVLGLQEDYPGGIQSVHRTQVEVGRAPADFSTVFGPLLIDLRNKKPRIPVLQKGGQTTAGGLAPQPRFQSGTQRLTAGNRVVPVPAKQRLRKRRWNRGHRAQEPRLIRTAMTRPLNDGSAIVG